MKGNSKLKLFLLLVVISTNGCLGACASIPNQVSEAQHLPRSSFVKYTHASLVEVCEEKSKRCVKSEAASMSSGIFVRHSEVKKNHSYILTTGHSCQPIIEKQVKQGDMIITPIATQHRIEDWYGQRYLAQVVRIDKKFDLCLLIVANVTGPRHAVPLAKHPAKLGEKVYNLAAPKGVFNKGMVLTFEGFFSGVGPSGSDFYSIPTKPGSSGSSIINNKGEIVGILFAGFPVMENIAVVVPLYAVKRFLKDTYAEGEMILWNSLPPKEKDKTSRAWYKIFD
jgi:S1-C subfamily serine protease